MKCSRVCGEDRNSPPGPTSFEGVERHLLVGEPDALRLHLELAQQLDVERELLERGAQAALEPAGGVQHDVGGGEVRGPQHHLRLGGGLRVDGRARGEPSPAAERQAVAPRELRTRRARPSTDSGVPNAGEPVRMSVTVKNEPYRHGTPSRTSWASATPLQRLGDLLREPAAHAHRARRAREQERRHDDRLLRLGPRDQRVGHAEVPDQRRVGVHDAHERGFRFDRLAAAVHDLGHADAVARARTARAVGGVRLVRVPDRRVLHVHVARSPSAGRSPRPRRPARSSARRWPGSASRTGRGRLMRPLRRPSSRSLANGGPPTFIHTGTPSGPPTVSERSGLRPRNRNDDGRLRDLLHHEAAIPVDALVRRPSARPRRAASRAGSCFTSVPISSRMRIAVLVDQSPPARRVRTFSVASCSNIVGFLRR